MSVGLRVEPGFEQDSLTTLCVRHKPLPSSEEHPHLSFSQPIPDPLFQKDCDISRQFSLL